MRIRQILIALIDCAQSDHVVDAILCRRDAIANNRVVYIARGFPQGLCHDDILAVFYTEAEALEHRTKLPEAAQARVETWVDGKRAEDLI